MTSPENTVPSVPAENVPRGTIFALIAIPAGVVVWCVLWRFGFVASIVALGVAYATVSLYRFGSGGRISRPGAIRIAVITIGTLLLAFFAGLVIDALPPYSLQFGVTWIEALTSPTFWNIFGHTVSVNLGSYAISFLIALAFGALGCFSVLRRAFQLAAAETPGPGYQPPQVNPTPGYAIQPPVPPAPANPTTPNAGPTLNGQPLDPEQKS